MASKDETTMADGTPPGIGPDIDPRSSGSESRRNPLNEPEVLKILNKPAAERSALDDMYLAARGARFDGTKLGFGPSRIDDPRYRSSPEESMPTSLGGVDAEGFPYGERELSDEEKLSEIRRKAFGAGPRSEQAFRDMVDNFENVADTDPNNYFGIDPDYMQQMRYQSPIFNDFVNILMRHKDQKIIELGNKPLVDKAATEALLGAMGEIRTRVLRVMVDQFRDDSTKEMPPQVGEMIQAINLLLARVQIVNARLEREKLNNLIEGMQYVQYCSAMAKYARSEWYKIPSNFYPHHWLSLFKIPGVVHATRALARPDHNGVLGATFSNPQIQEPEYNDYFSLLIEKDNGKFKSFGDMKPSDAKKNKTTAFDILTGYRVIQDAWEAEDHNHINGFNELFFDEQKATTEAKEQFLHPSLIPEYNQLKARDIHEAEQFLNDNITQIAKQETSAEPLPPQFETVSDTDKQRYLEQVFRSKVEGLNRRVSGYVNGERVKSQQEFKGIIDKIKDTRQPNSQLNENQKKLRALFLKALSIAHPGIGSDQYDRPIFAEVAARLIFDDKEGPNETNRYEDLLNYEIDGKKYRINRAAFIDIVNQNQLALSVGQRVTEALGIAAHYDGYIWKDKELPPEISNYLYFNRPENQSDPTTYGKNAKGGLVLLNPILEYKDPGDADDPEAEAMKGQPVTINLRLAGELAVRKGDYKKLSAWEKQQVRTLKILTHENTAIVMAAWAKAHRELLQKYSDYIDWEASVRSRGPRDATKHLKHAADLNSEGEMSTGEYAKLRELAYYNQISVLQAFSAGSAEDFLFKGIIHRETDPNGSDTELFKATSAPNQRDYGQWFNRYKYVYARWGAGEELRKIVEEVINDHHAFIDPAHIMGTMKKFKEKSTFLTSRKQTANETPERKEYLYDIANKILEYRTDEHFHHEHHMKELNARAVDILINLLQGEELINKGMMDDMTKYYLGNRLQTEVKIFMASLDKKGAIAAFFGELFKLAGESLAAGMKAA